MCVQIWSSMDDAVADGRRLSQSRLMQQICNFLHGAADRAEIFWLRLRHQRLAFPVAKSIKVELRLRRSDAARFAFV